MAFTLDQLATPASRKANQVELYRQADLEVNGSDRYYDLMSVEIEQHPLYCGHHGPRGIVF